jgi:hypothetical protein
MTTPNLAEAIARVRAFTEDFAERAAKMTREGRTTIPLLFTVSEAVQTTALFRAVLDEAETRLLAQIRESAAFLRTVRESIDARKVETDPDLPRKVEELANTVQAAHRALKTEPGSSLVEECKRLRARAESDGLGRAIGVIAAYQGRFDLSSPLAGALREVSNQIVSLRVRVERGEA